MVRKIITHIGYPVLIAGIVLGLFGVAQAATGNIDATDKWAWGTNVGWINFRPEHGGVTVYSDHLEGYAWGENIGWIGLGSHTGGGPHTYANTTKDNYGVNRDGDNLSGYAWAENVGWIHFKGTAPAYNVVTDFRPPPLVPVGGVHRAGEQVGAPSTVGGAGGADGGGRCSSGGQEA